MTDALHFERPPLDEVVCGVQFAGVEWSVIDFGLFYTQIRERYQRTQRRPPLLAAWFDKAHTAIVQTFLAQTTEEAHKEWRLS